MNRDNFVAVYAMESTIPERPTSGSPQKQGVNNLREKSIKKTETQLGEASDGAQVWLMDPIMTTE